MQLISQSISQSEVRCLDTQVKLRQVPNLESQAVIYQQLICFLFLTGLRPFKNDSNESKWQVMFVLV